MRVAILEDDPDQAELVSRWLCEAGHTVATHAAGKDFLRAVKRQSFDLYLLDWMLPDVSGIDVLRKLRQEMDDHTAVVMATAKDEERSVVRGLEEGADDYLVKPVSRAELVARVNAILRRAGGGNSGAADLHAEPYIFDLAKKAVTLETRDVSLTTREFELALFLFRNAGKIVSRCHILESIWGIENKSVSTRTVDTHMSRLRKKLELTEHNGWTLSAIYQHGYRLEKVKA